MGRSKNAPISEQSHNLGYVATHLLDGVWRIHVCGALFGESATLAEPDPEPGEDKDGRYPDGGRARLLSSSVAVMKLLFSGGGSPTRPHYCVGQVAISEVP